MFFDNINHTVKDENIAALLTATTWEDRLLGKTATAAAEVVSTFLFAGNNLRFTHELMRRNVPRRCTSPRAAAPTRTPATPSRST